MKFQKKLDQISELNNSQLCIGLDPDLSKLDKNLLIKSDPIFEFNKTIVDETCDLVCAYKPNIAFYEAYGIYGIQALMRTIEHIEDKKVPVILDAKRGDVGHTAAAYAKATFEVYRADAVTVNPYLGHDSVEPFLNYQDKGIFVLCLTSNIGVKDFQKTGDREPLYISVAKHVKEWNHYGNCGLVVGATSPEELRDIRKIVGDMPILIPGIGAQGGDLAASVRYGGKRAIINVSRNVIYSDNPRLAAKDFRDKINAAY